MNADEVRRLASKSRRASVIGSVEVLEPKIASSPITACALAMASALTLRSSNTASIDEVAARERAVVRAWP